MGKTTNTQKKEDTSLHYDVKIQSIRPEGTLRATATVNINDAFAIERRCFVRRKYGAALGACSSSPDTRMLFVLA